MTALDDATLACSTVLSKWEKERLAEKIKDLRLMFTVCIDSSPQLRHSVLNGFW
jgi:hypothetical protein